MQASEEGHRVACDSVGEPGGHGAEGNQPDTEGQILCDSTHRRSSRSQKQKVGLWVPGLGTGSKGQLVFSGGRVSVWQD